MLLLFWHCVGTEWSPFFQCLELYFNFYAIRRKHLFNFLRLSRLTVDPKQTVLFVWCIYLVYSVDSVSVLFIQMSVGSFQMYGSNFELFLGPLILREHLQRVNLLCSVGGVFCIVQHSLRKLAENAIPCMGSWSTTNLPIISGRHFHRVCRGVIPCKHSMLQDVKNNVCTSYVYSSCMYCKCMFAWMNVDEWNSSMIIILDSFIPKWHSYILDWCHLCREVNVDVIWNLTWQVE
jgi:hypothetical protein